MHKQLLRGGPLLSCLSFYISNRFILSFSPFTINESCVITKTSQTDNSAIIKNSYNGPFFIILQVESLIDVCIEETRIFKSFFLNITITLYSLCWKENFHLVSHWKSIGILCYTSYLAIILLHLLFLVTK